MGSGGGRVLGTYFTKLSYRKLLPHILVTENGSSAVVQFLNSIFRVHPTCLCHDCHLHNRRPSIRPTHLEPTLISLRLTYDHPGPPIPPSCPPSPCRVENISQVEYCMILTDSFLHDSHKTARGNHSADWSERPRIICLCVETSLENSRISLFRRGFRGNCFSALAWLFVRLFL
jgi:hypothetical protein